MANLPGNPAARLPKLRPACHRCGAPLAHSPAASCTRCYERPRPSMRSHALRLTRWKLRTLLILIALAAFASAWCVRAHLLRLADDSGQFYSHEEMAGYQSFLKACALQSAREAEQKAAEGGVDRPRWAAEAGSMRARADGHARTEGKYRGLAELKQRLRPGSR